MTISYSVELVHVTKDCDDYLQRIAMAVEGSRNVVVITGAGISTGAGIPDFRSKDGLYASGQRNTQALFHITALSHPTDGAALLDLCDSLHRDAEAAHPTQTHRFIKGLSMSNKLLRNYSQNIDDIERKVGLSTDLTRGVECVQLHGSLRDQRCLRCGKCQTYVRRKGEVSPGSAKLMYCPVCPQTSRRAGLRKPKPGLLRPDIILYGEADSRSDTISGFIKHDMAQNVDLLLIIGTSLSVPGIRILAKTFAEVVHQHNGIVVFVNLSKPITSIWNKTIDFWVEWGCDDWVGDLRQRVSMTGSCWPSKSPEITMALAMKAGKQVFNVSETSPVLGLACATPNHHGPFQELDFMPGGSQEHPIDLTGD